MCDGTLPECFVLPINADRVALTPTPPRLADENVANLGPRLVYGIHETRSESNLG